MTDEKVYWLIPQNFENIIPEEANEIGFTYESIVNNISGEAIYAQRGK